MSRQIDGFTAWDRQVRDVANMGYTIAMNLSIFNPELIFTCLPPAWTEYYQRHLFTIRDPILHWASYNEGYTRWSAIEGTTRGIFTKRVMDVASTFDLKFGAICVARNNEPHRRKCFLSVARNDRELTQEELETTWALFSEALDSFRIESGLTRAEIQVLRLLAEGQTQEEIGSELGITRDSVKKRVERARAALDAENTIHAIALAYKKGII